VHFVFSTWKSIRFFHWRAEIKREKMKQIVEFLGIAVLAAGVAQASTVLDFTSFNNADASTGMVGGSTNGLTISKSTVVVGGVDQYLFSVTYTGADYDGDAVNDTLTFDLRVAAMSGNTVSLTADPDAEGTSYTGSMSTNTGSAASVGITSDQFVSGASLMSNGETLIFTVENLVVAGLPTFVGTPEFDTFKMVETSASYGHVSITGIGGPTLQANKTNVGLVVDLSSNLQNPLYISAVNPLGSSSNPQRWSVSNIGFNLTISPPARRLSLIGITAQ
jgi:hypothetical protein